MEVAHGPTSVPGQLAMNRVGNSPQRDRNLSQLENEVFDLVVVGGGIHGVAATLEAARRGLRTVLLEQDDFGDATSRNSLQVLHGGLRYLQSLDAHRFRESVRNRAFFLREFPDLTEPMRFVLPLDGRGLRRPPVLRVALRLNDWASRSLQRDLPSAQVLPPGEIWSRDQLRAEYPEIAAESLIGAAVWSDGHLSSPQRVLMEMLRWSAGAGAIPINHARVVAGQLRSGVLELEIADRIGDRTLGVRAERVLICAGPWSHGVASLMGGGKKAAEGVGRHLHPLSLAFNVLLRGRLPRNSGIGLTGPSGRNLFLWEREGLIRLGTCHAPWPADASASHLSNPEPSAAEVRIFLAEASEAAPGLALEEKDLIGLQCGVLTAHTVGAHELAHRDAIVLHREHGGLPGIASVHGVKYTSAPSAAVAGLKKLWGELPPRSNGMRPPSRGPIGANDLVERMTSDPASVEALCAELRREEWVTSDDELLRGRIDGTEDPHLYNRLREFLSPKSGS